jgi:16S rRNA (guanine966-N2)-methyltransferase
MAKSKHTIRIISGTHGKRRLPVLDLAGLRPTGDRLRETLFNWLQFSIAAENILDLCAGSGALGFEAASRGAKKVTMIDVNSKVIDQLNKIKEEFKFNNVLIKQQLGQDFLRASQEQYGIIFLDPPFNNNSIQELVELAIGHISVGGYLYCEFSKDQEMKILADNWELFRKKTTAQVRIELWQRIK